MRRINSYGILWSKCFGMARPPKGGENINVVFARERYSRVVKFRASCSVATTVAAAATIAIAVSDVTDD